MRDFYNSPLGGGGLRIHCFQHVAFENPGTILEWIQANNHSISYTFPAESPFPTVPAVSPEGDTADAANNAIPQINDIDALIVMGGAMNTDEEEKYPWMKAEKQFIKAAADAGKKIIGICLGSQLVAAALGTRVYKNKETEIGFFPLSFTDAALQTNLFSHFKNPYTVFHWHGDTFDLPANALLIASSAACKHQAYLIGNHILGLQFHFEMNETVIEDMLLHDGHELEQSGEYIQSPQQVRENYFHLQQNKKDMFLLLDKFFV